MNSTISSLHMALDRLVRWQELTAPLLSQERYEAWLDEQAFPPRSAAV